MDIQEYNHIQIKKGMICMRIMCVEINHLGFQGFEIVIFQRRKIKNPKLTVQHMVRFKKISQFPTTNRIQNTWFHIHQNTSWYKLHFTTPVCVDFFEVNLILSTRFQDIITGVRKCLLADFPIQWDLVIKTDCLPKLE